MDASISPEKRMTMHEERLHVAIAAHQAGRLDDAEQAYRQILQEDAAHADAHHNLGVLLRQRDDLLAALPHFRTALERVPAQGQYWISYIEALILAGQKDAARKILEQGQQAGLPTDVVTAFEQRLQAPVSEEVQQLLGLYRQRHFDQAEAKARALSERFPFDAFGWKMLGVTGYALGKLDMAHAAFQRSIALAPLDAESHNNLGNLLRVLGRLPDAERCYRMALKLQPDHPDFLNNLGVTLKNLGRLPEAESCYHKILKQYPDMVGTLSNYGVVLKEQGRYEEAVGVYRRALKLAPETTDTHSNLLFALNFVSGLSRKTLLDEALAYGQRVSAMAPVKLTEGENRQIVDRLKVGFVSGDLRTHPVGYFLESVVANVDSSCLELHAFSSDPREDELTKRLRPYFAQWHSLIGLSDEAAARLIQANAIDILIDLSGHTARNRLPVFAWRPAPLQLTWLGYFATTGVAEIDAILVDRAGVPPGQESQFTEAVVYLPETRLCFTPPQDAPPVAELPALKNGTLTFGCFQSLAKVSDEVIALWAKVFAALPTARLRWQCNQFSDPLVVRHLVERLEENGIAAQRIQLCPPTGRISYLAAHAEIDVILDTFPYPGGTTTCEALWMGVPTLTLAGKNLLSRQGASLMCAAGLPDWVAETKTAYIEQAIRFARDLPALAGLRKKLRDQVADSPLMDARRFARHFEQTLQELFRSYTSSSKIIPE